MVKNRIKILVLGAAGMLGHTLFRYLSQSPSYSCFGTIRSQDDVKYFSSEKDYIIPNLDATNLKKLNNLFLKVKPQVVINCIGIVKQITDSNDPLQSIPINSLLPHQLAFLSTTHGARLIHISTDCVFSGAKGLYSETDFPDANDLYGRSKFLGEVNYTNSVTLRTSIIGHELHSKKSLVNWFLSQQGRVDGFSKAIFSGLPTIELSNIIANYVIPNKDLWGVYHVSSKPIDKFQLLHLIKTIYNKKIFIDQNDSLKIDRSLDSSRFKLITGYKSPDWADLVQNMKNFG